MYAGTRFSLVFSYVGSSSSLGSHLLGRGHLIHTPGFPLFVPGTLSCTSPFISRPLQRMVVCGIKYSHTSVLCSPNSMGFSFMPLNIYPVPSTQPSRYTVNSHLGINNSETLWQVFYKDHMECISAAFTPVTCQTSLLTGQTDSQARHLRSLAK